MVLPGRDDGSPAWSKWRRTLIRISLASLACGALWFAVSRSLQEATIALAVPWAVALVFIVITLTWGIMVIPPMLLIHRLIGAGEETTTSANNPSHHTTESRAEARLPAAGER